MRTLKENYKRNVEIMGENLRRGMSASQAINVIRGWRNQFEKAGMLGEEEKAFLNECLALVEEQTHMSLTIM